MTWYNCDIHNSKNPGDVCKLQNAWQLTEIFIRYSITAVYKIMSQLV